MERSTRFREFTAFFMGYRPKLVAVVSRILPGRRDDIQDVLQEVWIKGAKAWPPRDIALARSWLGRIAINEAISNGRRAKRSPIVASLNDDDRPIDRPDPGPAPDELVMHREMHRALVKLKARSPRQVAALRLVFLEGHTYLEAAGRLDIVEGTAKSQAFKAIESLRQSLTAPKAA